MACPNHTEPTLTDEQVDNLYTLAEFLELLPDDYEKFEMSVFLQRPSGGGNERVTHRSVVHENVCGTVACAVGHGPTAGIMPSKKTQGWHQYAHEKFCNQNTDVFAWCFGANWSYADNTPSGAAARIRYMLANGVPDYWHGLGRREQSQIYEGCLIKNRQKEEVLAE